MIDKVPFIFTDAYNNCKVLEIRIDDIDCIFEQIQAETLLHSQVRI